MTRTAERAHGRRCAVALGVVLALASAGIHPVSAATLRVIDRDGAGEGFNDPTPVLPVGGNGGTTLGEQRLNAFQYAADIWGGLLRSDVEIRIGATFDPLICDSMRAVLGQAGPDSGFRNFIGAPLADVMYSGALADMFAGMDLDPGQDDITATFNSAFGTTCPFPGSWYLGLDGAASGGQTDLVTVVLHELGHGLGFSTTVDVQTGRRAFGVDDAFMLHLEDNLTGELFPDLTDAQRREAIIATGLLRWDGPNVSGAASSLFSGADSRGHVNMYAPDPVVVGSSVVHFDTSVSPGQLMAPFLTVPTHDIGLTLPVFEDMGWQRTAAPACAGDCNGDGEVTIEELVDAVRIALAEIPISACAAADTNQDGEVSINEVVSGVNAGLDGCSVSAASSTATTGVRGDVGVAVASAAAAATSAASDSAHALAAAPTCIGDCDGNGEVTIDELVRAVRIPLGELPVSECPAIDANGDGEVSINELIAAVGNALSGCAPPGSTATPTGTPVPESTPTPDTTPPTATATPATACPFDFFDDTADPNSPVCDFQGRWNPDCGDAMLEAAFAASTPDVAPTPGVTPTPAAPIVVIGLVASLNPDMSRLTFIAGVATSARSADIFGWFTNIDDNGNITDLTPLAGTIDLGADGGSLTISPATSPFLIDGCDFVQYAGDFTVLIPPAQGAAAARSSAVAPAAARRALAALLAQRANAR